MVWGFGSKPPAPAMPKLPDGMAPLQLGSRDDELSKQEKEKAEKLATQYRFDSAALERAAKAAKDLERSPHAKELLDLTKTQELTRQLELQQKNNQFVSDIERLRHEEQRKTLDQQAKLAQQKAQYEDKLARLRYKDQLEEQRRAQDEKLQREAAHQEQMLQRQQQAIAEQEEIRRRTIDYEVKRKSEEDMKRIQAEYKGKAIYERETKDIHYDQIKLEAEENRLTAIQSIEMIGSVVGQGFKQFFSDWNLVRSTALGLTLVAGGIYTAKYTVKTIESRIGKPRLLRETSRLNAIDLFRHPVLSAKRMYASRRPEDSLKDVILRPALEENLRDVAIATRNTKLNRSFYRNLMFFGPPGTGKTLFAKKLAQHSGMDYAVMSGGDVAPMGQTAVTAIHKVFDWSQTSRRGLLLFIDEAEAFLCERRTGKLSEELNAFLHRAGEQSNKFMLVLSTNIPEQLDESVVDRIDKSIKFDIPSLDERKRLVSLYFEKYVLEPASRGGRRRLKVEDFDYVGICDKIAHSTEGLSGRAISKIGVAWQAAAFATINRTLTEAMVVKCVDEAIEEHKERQKWRRH